LLHIAAENGHLAMVQLLLAQGYDANVRLGPYGYTPLHVMADEKWDLDYADSEHRYKPVGKWALELIDAEAVECRQCRY